MSAMKKVLSTVAVAATMAAAGTAANAEDMRIALVVKALGIGFFEAAAKGAEEAAAELGDTEIIYTGPTDTTAEGQIEVINSLIAQGVDAIAISANDPDALVPSLKKAMQRGITVILRDSGVAEEGRQMHFKPSSTELIGNTIIKLAADHMPDGGDVAILSASATATNQNAWIEEPSKDGAAELPGCRPGHDRLWRRPVGQVLPRSAGPHGRPARNLKAIIAPTSRGHPRLLPRP